MAKRKIYILEIIYKSGRASGRFIKIHCPYGRRKRHFRDFAGRNNALSYGLGAAKMIKSWAERSPQYAKFGKTIALRDAGWRE